MRYRDLGTTGIRISEIGFGCGDTAGLLTGGAAEEQRRAIERALELGVTHFDTAPNYGERTGGTGSGETNLGRMLREAAAKRFDGRSPVPDAGVESRDRPADRFAPIDGRSPVAGAGVESRDRSADRFSPIIATKIDFRSDDLADIRSHIRRSVDASLERLGVDAIDILYLHNRVGPERVLRPGAMNSRMAVADVLGSGGVAEAFDLLRSEGLVRVAGFCSSSGDVEANQQIIQSGGFQCVQLVYNLFNPTEGRRPPAGFEGQDYGQTIEAAAERGLGVVTIKVLAGGPLGGAPEPHPLNRGSRTEGEFAAGARRARALQFLEAEGEHTLAQAAIQYVLTNPGVSCALVGFSSAEQVEQAAWASDQGGLLPGDMSSIEDLYAKDFGVMNSGSTST